jgi:aerobic carbon-monoxide dehydrogenase large subunit
MSEQQTANRREDLRLITGRGRYAADWNVPGQLYACYLRSDRAHAEIVSIDAAAALACPGVVAVLTGADAVAAGYTKFPSAVSFKGCDGKGLLKTERPVLAAGKVRYVGETVAMVVAESALAAQDAVGAIDIEYRELPVAVTVEDALAPGAPQLHDNIPGNQCFEWEVGDASAVEEVFKRAAHVARSEVATTRVIANPMEPRACLVHYDAVQDSYEIYSCSQGITMLRRQLAALTGVPEERLHLHAYDVGGAFGQRSAAYPEYAAQMIAAKRLGRPIKWVSTRSESFLSDYHGRGITMSGELALDRDGTFLATRFDFICDVGAYLSPNAPGGHLRNTATCMTGVYRIPVAYGHFRVALTNGSPIAPYRGAGRPDVAYAVERLVDQAAADMRIDPVELRRRNFIPRDAFPYQTPTNFTYEEADFAGCLDKALKGAHWAGFPERREAARKAGKLRGIGLASVIEGTGPGAAAMDQVAIEFDAEGHLHVYTVALSSGQSHETTFGLVVAQTLGVDAAQVAVHESISGKNLLGNQTGGSRSMVGAGSVCKLAAQKLIEQGRSLAAEELSVEPSQVDYAHGVYRVHDSSRQVGLFELARKHAGKTPHPLDLVAGAKVGSTYPNGCHIAEVEIDPETGVTEIVSYTAVDDAGVVISHSVAEGQVHGAVTQGAGQIFGEKIVYDRESGQLITGSFSDYFMPRAGFVRDIHIDENPVPSKANALGAKGLGESGCTGSLPALANAMMNALREAGVARMDMPFTAARVWHALQDAKKQTGNNRV